LSETTATPNTADADPRHWAGVAARAADAKLGTDTVVVDVGAVLAITDMFVITTASNSRQVKAIADEVERQLHLQGGPRCRSVEGLEELQWVLLDFGDIVVHVFVEEARAYFSLDRLWSDRPRIDWQAA
jgi:ribosome-associated protein